MTGFLYHQILIFKKLAILSEGNKVRKAQEKSPLQSSSFPEATIITSFLRFSTDDFNGSLLKEKKVTFYLKTPLRNKPIYQHPSLYKNELF